MRKPKDDAIRLVNNVRELLYHGANNDQETDLNISKDVAKIYLDYILENCEYTRYLTDQDYKSDVHWYNRVKEEVRNLKGNE
jgi:hypothetical protein